MRIASLTGLRGLAAVSVLIYHIPHAPAFTGFATSLFDRGYLCVDLFFVLSGFVIAYGYYHRVVENPGLASYGDFLINRIARVWPLHSVVAGVFLLRILLNVSGQQNVDPTPANLITNLLMVQSWGWGTAALAGNSWSVSTELVAYIAFPLLALFAFSRWAWIQAGLALALLLLVARYGHGARGPLDVNDADSVLPVLRCIAGFALGIIAYRFSRLERARAMLGSDGAFAAICLLIIAALMVPRGDVLVVLLWPLLVIACACDGRLSRALLANRIAFHLGLISYSIYLWHPLVRDVAARAMGVAARHGVTGWDWLFVAAIYILTWLVSWASYELIELRGHRAIKRLQRHRAAPVPAAEQPG